MVREHANGTEHEKVQEAIDCESEEGGHGEESRDAVAVTGAVTAPDGGWGWVVLVATIIVLALTLAFPSCVGIFYTDLQNEFDATNSETSWVPSIMTSALHAGGKTGRPGSKMLYLVSNLFILICNLSYSTSHLK